MPPTDIGSERNLSLLIPEKMKNTVYEYSAGLLTEEGIRGVIFDIDNTLVPYEKAEPDEELLDYFRSLGDCGIGITLVSNNTRERVEIFNKKTHFFAAPNAHKPRGKHIRECIKALGTEKSGTVLIGDQIFTDCLAAHLVGIRCFTVKPIAKKETAFFKFKRFFEKPFIRAYKRRERIRERK